MPPSACCQRLPGSRETEPLGDDLVQRLAGVLVERTLERVVTESRVMVLDDGLHPGIVAQAVERAQQGGPAPPTACNTARTSVVSYSWRSFKPLEIESIDRHHSAKSGPQRSMEKDSIVAHQNDCYRQ